MTEVKSFVVVNPHGHPFSITSDFTSSEIRRKINDYEKELNKSHKTFSFAPEFPIEISGSFLVQYLKIRRLNNGMVTALHCIVTF